MQYVNIFISHSWDYADHYNKIKEWLNNKYNNIRYYCVPQDDPFYRLNSKELGEAIKAQIRMCSIFIIPAGMYTHPTYSKWIVKEVQVAKYFNKKILVVKPWRQENMPQYLQAVASKIVGWNSSSVTEAVRELCS